MGHAAAEGAPVVEPEVLCWLDAKNRASFVEWRGRRIRMSIGGLPDPRDEYALEAYRRIVLRRARLQGRRFQIVSALR